MLTKTTELIIVYTIQNKQEELDKLLHDLEYHELMTLYAMCLNLSKSVRRAPNFGNPPERP